jgi:HK97 family phage prohead protease
MTPWMYSRPSFVVKHLEDQGEFSGYASTHHVDHADDLILPGAFSKTLAKWTSKKGRFPHIYWEHDTEEIIAVCKDMHEDKHGLYVQGKLLMDIPKAQQAYTSLQRGINGLSIGFFVMKSFSKNGVRTIQEAELKEVSFVHTPCNDRARIHEYKSELSPNDLDLIAHIARLKSTLID